MDSNVFRQLAEQVTEKCTQMASEYRLDDGLPENVTRRISELTTVPMSVEEAFVRARRIQEAMQIHAVLVGTKKKLSPENLEKLAAKNESLAKWKWDSGKDDEAEKARKRAETYKKQAEKLRKKQARQGIRN